MYRWIWVIWVWRTAWMMRQLSLVLNALSVFFVENRLLFVDASVVWAVVFVSWVCWRQVSAFMNNCWLLNVHTTYQGRICLGSCMCCPSGMQVADHICYLGHSNLTPGQPFQAMTPWVGDFRTTKLSESKFLFFFFFFNSVSTYIQCATRRLSLCDIHKYRFPAFYGTSGIRVRVIHSNRISLT